MKKILSLLLVAVLVSPLTLTGCNSDSTPPADTSHDGHDHDEHEGHDHGDHEGHDHDGDGHADHEAKDH